MRAQPPESLSEFEPEDRPAPVARPEVGGSGSILDVVVAASPADTPPAPLSRIESRRARKRTSPLKRLARAAIRTTAWQATIAHAVSLSRRVREQTVSAVRATGRASRRMTGFTVSAAHVTGHVCTRAWSIVRSSASATRQHTSAAVNGAWTQAWSSARPHFGARTTARTVLEDLEFNGTIIAMSLAMAALAYSGFRGGPGAAPAVPLSARAIERTSETAPLPVAPPVAVLAVPAAALPIPAAEAAKPNVAMRPVKAALSATTLNAIWRRQDSRSLQRAFTGLRGQTLAFHRCGMRMTDADRAVATCEGAQRAKWTINFRRSAGRWQIDRVITR